MVELTTAAAVALGGAISALVLGLLVLAVRTRRHISAVHRRLASVMARLEDPGARARQERDSVGRLEQLAETSVLRHVEAEAAQARLAGALRSIGHGVVVCDEAGVVVFRNEAADMMPEETIAEALGAALGGERLFREIELYGSPSRRLGLSAHPLDDGARPVGAVVVVEDRSEGRRADLVRQDFLANVTAELRAPVAALDLLAGTIANDLATEEHPQLAGRLAERLAGEARRASRVIEDVAELSRLDAGVPPPAGPVPVHLLVAEAMEAAMAAATASGVSVKASEPAPDLTVVGDRRHLVSALRHLVDNAVRFSPPGGIVTVQASAEDGWVLLAVSDDGPGVPPHERDRIFESFYRAAGDRSPGRGGSGLGLAIAARAAAGHGGEILVDSSPGVGSVFTLKLPSGP